MEEIVRLMIGVLVLILGISIGNYLAKITKEELKDGRKWFKLIVLVSMFIGFLGLIIQSDFMLFSGFFVAIVTSRSLVERKVRAKKK